MKFKLIAYKYADNQFDYSYYREKWDRINNDDVVMCHEAMCTFLNLPLDTKELPPAIFVELRFSKPGKAGFKHCRLLNGGSVLLVSKKHHLIWFARLTAAAKKHKVDLTKSFWIKVTPTTYEDYNTTAV